MPKVHAFRSAFYLNIANYNGDGTDHWEPVHDARFAGSCHYKEAIRLRSLAYDNFHAISRRWTKKSFRTVRVIGAVDR